MEFFMIFTRLRSMVPHAKLLVYQVQPTKDSGRHAQWWLSDVHKPRKIRVVHDQCWLRMCRLWPMRVAHIWLGLVVVCIPRVMREVQRNDNWVMCTDYIQYGRSTPTLNWATWKSNDWCVSARPMSPWRYCLTLADVSCLKHIRFRWFWLPFLDVEVAGFGWCCLSLANIACSKRTCLGWYCLTLDDANVTRTMNTHQK